MTYYHRFNFINITWGRIRHSDGNAIVCSGKCELAKNTTTKGLRKFNKRSGKKVQVFSLGYNSILYIFQSNKATIEIMSRFDGVMDLRYREAGDMMSVGEKMLYITTKPGAVDRMKANDCNTEQHG